MSPYRLRESGVNIVDVMEHNLDYDNSDNEGLKVQLSLLKSFEELQEIPHCKALELIHHQTS